MIVEGQGVGDIRRIKSSLNDTIEVVFPWSQMPTDKSRYVIVEGSKTWGHYWGDPEAEDNYYSVVLYPYAITQAETAFTVVRWFLANTNLMTLQDDCQSKISTIEQQLSSLLSLNFIRVPAIYRSHPDGAKAWLPATANLLNTGSKLIIADSHVFGTGEHDDGTCKTRFYFDNNTSGDSETGPDDPHVDSPSYEAQELTYHFLTFGKSSAVAGTPGTSAACSTATALILRKDTADDYRATAKFLPAGLSTIPASTHDPLKMERVGDHLEDTWYHWSYFINYDSAEVIIVSDIIPCDANGHEVSPDTAGFFMPGTDSGICADEIYFGGNNLAHEVGHSCGLSDVTSGQDRVMYWTTAGNETLLTQSEAAAYE